MQDIHIPIDAPNDAVMANPDEVRRMADWAAAAFTGSELRLDESLMFTTADPPFSFACNGRSSAEFLKSWKRTADTKEMNDFTEHHVRWTDPDTGLSVSAVVKVFKRYPAVDWVLYFENCGTKDTPIIENIQALDTELRTDNSVSPTVLHQTTGDTGKEDTFSPLDTDLPAGEAIHLAPRGGRPSAWTFPFFNFQHGERGIITAVGWTGQWAASFDRDEAGHTQLKAGMEQTHLLLHPGERIRTPRMLLMNWNGDLQTSYNRFRRLILFNYFPKQNGRPARMPTAFQCFDRYFYSRPVPAWSTEAGQLNEVKVAEQFGCDTHWLDAAWFPGRFPWGVGNLMHRPEAFPNGLKPISDECHKRGIRFLLWFEPERATEATQSYIEHPEFYYEKTIAMFGGPSRLLKLSDPTARRWMTDKLSNLITEYGVDIYRNDFNIEPLRFWRENDEPDRQGMTEIRYVEGLYEMWDELRARHPGLLIDNCAGGGTRIDIEMCMRSVPMWRSDTGGGMGPDEPNQTESGARNPDDWNQTQSCGMSPYIPLHSLVTWTPKTYNCRSTATAGGIFEWDYLSETFPLDLAKESLKEIKENQKYWYGDFYMLTPCKIGFDQMLAWQLHRSDLDEGIVLAFRRKECVTLGMIVGLRGLEQSKTFTVTFIDDGRNSTTKTMSGRELASGIELILDKPESSLLVRYKVKR